MTRSHFQLCSSRIETVFLQKSYLLCVKRFEQTTRPTALVVVWRREEARRLRCTVRRTQTSEPTLTASGLAARRHAERAYIEVSCPGISYFTISLTAAASGANTNPRRGARRVRLRRSLGPGPRQLTAVWPRRDEPPADCTLGAKQRRYTAMSPSNSCTVLLLLAVVDKILNLDAMPFFKR